MTKQGSTREKAITRDSTRRFSEGDVDYVPIDKTFARQLSSVEDKGSDTEMSETSDDEENSTYDEEAIQQMKEKMAKMAKEVAKFEKGKKKKKEKHKKEQINRSEVVFSICGKETPDEIDNGEHSKTGLVVICHHSRFKLRGHSLSERPSSHVDMNMMDSIWKQYGCEVLLFREKTNQFYDEDLIKNIREQAKAMSTISFFVLVLSTHGEEKEESKVHGEASYQHYFYTSNGQIHTQKVINDIEDIEEIKDKTKMFFIQACRSRANPWTEDQNLDLGYELKVQLTLKEEISPTTETISIEGQAQLRRSGRTIADARGYMPPEVKSVQFEYEPTVWVPHCDESIVMFASMSGKYAYSLTNSELEGGWLIKSLDDVLKSYKSGEEIHILDVLIEVNRRVANRETDYNKKHDGVLKAQSCFLFNISDDLYLKRS